MSVGIIGGTGVYDPDLLQNKKEVKIHTPYGQTSDVFTYGILQGTEVFILPRHGHGHRFSPSNVPYRANMWAFKELGVKRIISVSAVGSLKEEIKPGHFVFTDQFIDRTQKRNQTYYETGQVAHISVANAFCKNLREHLINSATTLALDHHKKGTCVVIEGPRFSTVAESNVYRMWNADIINMTLVPEVVLANELEISYANIATVTDYDVWRDSHVSNADVLETMKKNVIKVKKLLMHALKDIDDTSDWPSNQTLKNALM